MRKKIVCIVLAIWLSLIVALIFLRYFNLRDVIEDETSNISDELIDFVIE